MAWMIVVALNLLTVIVAAAIALLLTTAAQFAANDGPLSAPHVPMSWSLVLQAAAVPLSAFIVFFILPIALLRRGKQGWAFGLTSVPYMVALVTWRVWWRLLVLSLR